jgi:hypothetical protein
LADPLLDSLSMRLIIQGTKKENTDFPALCTIDSCCRISCGLDCLPGDCAEQFGELCQEGVATETASECRDELRMLHWFRTYGLFLRRNCLLHRVIEWKIQGGIEVLGRQGRRRTKLLNDFKERRGYSHLKKEALDRSTWGARFGIGFGPVVRQTTKWMNMDSVVIL